MSDFIELTRVDGSTVAIRHSNIDSIEVGYRLSEKVYIIKRDCAGLSEVRCKESPSEIVAKIDAAQKAND